MRVFHEIEPAMEWLDKGMSCFLTGSAGTGKTTSLKELLRRWKARKVALTATTNCAAKNMTAITGVDAFTIHGWSGIDTMDEYEKAMRHILTRNQAAVGRIEEVDVVVVEEVSMLPLHVLNVINRVLQHVRKNDLPFGGIQFVFVGDFYQLPPVEGRFCFEWEWWSEYVAVTIFLKKVHRQKDDAFVAMLNEVREAKVSDATIAALKQKVVLDPWSTELPVALFPTNQAADSLNSYRYSELNGQEYKFDVVASAGKKKPTKMIKVALEKLLDEMPARRSLKLKVGAKIICVANVNDTLVNGSLGVVNGFKGGWPEVIFAHGKEVVAPFKWELSVDGCIVSATQVPLQLAWGITIHKAQGMTLAYGGLDAGRSIFAPAQTYVALSRFSSLEKCVLFAFDPKKITTDPSVVDFYSRLC
jgi:ATP-dependent exoDNAse (exonuclease V) alpha subunit